MLQNKINGHLDLLALAKCKSQQEDSRLYDFVLNRSQKKLKELVKTSWEVERATEKIARSKMSRLDIMQ